MKPQAPPINPARFNNPLALKVAWTPNEYSGVRLRTHRLIQPVPHRLEFRACIKNYVIGAGMSLAGLAIMGVKLATVIFGTDKLDFTLPLVLLFGAAFVFFGIVILIVFTKPVVFDKHMGRAWSGREPPPDTKAATALNVPLNRIKAIQLVAESCSHKGGSFLSYELNVVLDDATRRTIIDHGILGRVRQDAATLATFLGIPVWDAIE